MADTINATDLPLETSNTLDGTEKIIGFDVNQGKAITVAELAEYILQKKVSSLAGSNQTLAAALTALNSNTVKKNGNDHIFNSYFDDEYALLRVIDPNGYYTNLVFHDTGKIEITRYANGSWKPSVTLRQADS